MTPTWDPVYETDQGWVLHRYELSTGNTIRVAAKDVRRAPTGTHAIVAISMNWVSLAWSNFNVERDEDRVRLTNSAWSHLDNASYALDGIEFPKNLLKHALDLFCLGLWDNEVGADLGGQLAGDPERPPAVRLLGDYVLQGGGTILFGPPGTGKSYTALAMAASCQWGIESIWRVHDAWPCLYLNVERSAGSMAGRLARVNKALGIDPRTSLAFLNARGKSLSDIYEAARRTIEKEGCQWVIYDSLSRAGFGSLVADDTANRIMDMLNALTPTWLALAHSPRGDATHAYGSQMFDAAADLTLQMRAQVSADGRSTGIGIEGQKANDIERPKLKVHVLEWDENGLTGIRRGRSGEFAELSSEEKRTKEELVRSYLGHVGKSTTEEVAKEFGWRRAHTSTLLNAMNGLGKDNVRPVKYWLLAEGS